MDQFAQIAKAAAREAGFDLCGIAAIDEAGMRELAQFPAWVSSGYAGEMEYLKAAGADGKLKREAPRSTAPWARSVIVCALNYDTEQPYSTEVAANRRNGWIARYAWSKDYHDVVLSKLRQVEAKLISATREAGVNELTTRCYVDTGPHVERVYAKYAGIGWMGKNTCILNERLGSWIFLGIILISLEMTADLPTADRCGTCTRCIDACPTQALLEPYKLDATRCISYLTIEKRGDIPEDLRPEMGNHVFGCDICQDVCPWNDAGKPVTNRTPFSQVAELQSLPDLVNPALDWLAEMSPEEFQKTFKGSPVKRAKYSGLRRNAAVAMGNSGRLEFAHALEELARDEDATVAEHARWALERLKRA
jgi:epoxyqueuosine reductase